MTKLLYSLCLTFLFFIHLPAYVYNPYVDPYVWEQLTPYFLPEDHPIKSQLDSIFRKRRVLKSIYSLHSAGFRLITHPDQKIIVVKHDKIKGHLLKLFLDDNPEVDWIWWKKRIDGAKVIANAIQTNGYEHILKVPKKWIYPLPAHPSPESTEGIVRKNFVLVVEKMDILSEDKNRKAWKKKMTPMMLDALYTMIMENLLLDSVYADNIPFCKDGKIAFVDTEHTLDTTQAIPIWVIGNFLSKEMLAYWEQLIVHGVQNSR